MVNKFKFRSLTFSDVPLMHQWFNLPHVQKFYSLRMWTETEVFDKLKPYINGDKPVLGFIVLMNEKPVGYIQQFKIMDYPWPNQNLSEEIINNAVGMDIFIGDETLVGKGFGGKMIVGFIETKIWPEFQYCIVDPDTRNTAAIRCYEKLNFQSHAVINSKDALGQLVKLNLMILKRY
jgi:RimJ/RimL family protein N-acetyltransferase